MIPREAPRGGVMGRGPPIGDLREMQSGPVGSLQPNPNNPQMHGMPQLGVQQGVQQGVQPAVQYMYCIVPNGQQLPGGAVPIGHLDASQLPNGTLPLSQFNPAMQMSQLPGGNLNNGTMPSGGMPMGQMSGAPLSMDKDAERPWNNQQLPGRAPARPSRGRSPRGRSPQGRPSPSAPSAPMMQPTSMKQPPPNRGESPKRDWASLRRPVSKASGETPTNVSGGAPKVPQNWAQAPPVPKAGFNMGAGHGRAAQLSQPATGGLPFNAGNLPQRTQSPNRPQRPQSPINGNGNMPQRPHGNISQRPQSPNRLQRPQSPISGFQAPNAARDIPLPIPSRSRAQSADRRRTGDRRTSAERRISQERRPKSVGPSTTRMKGRPQSGWWIEQLPASCARVFYVADGQAVAAAMQLIFSVGPHACTAVDCQGINLKAGGRLSLIQLAFRVSPDALEVFMFDVIQLGEHIRALKSFMQNSQATKLVLDAETSAMVLAQQLGITLAGVIDVKWAFSRLFSREMGSLNELLRLLDISPLGVEDKLHGIPSNAWQQRPLPNSLFTFAVRSVCSLHDASPALWQRLMTVLGGSAFEVVARYSQMGIQAAASIGFSKAQGRNGRIEDNDAELDNWLARRFGGAATREPSRPRGGARGHDPDVFPPGHDASPWLEMSSAQHRSQSQGVPLDGAAVRCNSPTLQNWLDRRADLVSANARQDASPVRGRARRAASMPANKNVVTSGFPACLDMFQLPSPVARPPIPVDLGEDRRAWVELTEEESAAKMEAEQDAEETKGLFEDLQQVERRRLAQVEREGRHHPTRLVG